MIETNTVDFLAGYLYKCFEEFAVYGSDEEQHEVCIIAKRIPTLGNNISPSCASIIELTLEQLRKINQGKHYLDIKAESHLHFVKFTLTITEPKKKLTVAEIEKLLGYKVEIVPDEIKHFWKHHKCTPGGIHDTYICSHCGYETGWTTPRCPGCGEPLQIIGGE